MEQGVPITQEYLDNLGHIRAEAKGCGLKDKNQFPLLSSLGGTHN